MKEKGVLGAKPLAEWAFAAVDTHFHKILKHEPGVLRDEDPEELHQMRVGTRRLRSALTGFAPALELPGPARQERVGKIARTLGELRDLDVLKESLTVHHEPILPKKEQKSLKEALKVLASRRERVFKEVSSLLRSPLYRDFLQAFRDWLEKPTYQPTAALTLETVLPDLLLPRASSFLLHEGWSIGVKEGTAENGSGLPPEEVERLLEKEGLLLHDLRKEAKRTRYNLELFTRFYGEGYREHLGDIKATQEILGGIQDCHVLAEFLREVFGRGMEKEMPALAANFQKIRFQKWGEWRPLQRKYLSAATRKSLHASIVHPVFGEREVESAN
jgi:CHAD domain-containing protein